MLPVKRPVKRRQRAPRPASPYSTDSNYSAILAAAPHKPYPKSERRRQLAAGRQGRHHGRHGNSGNQGSAAMSPALRPLPREFFTSFPVLFPVSLEFEFPTVVWSIGMTSSQPVKTNLHHNFCFGDPT